jgi:CRISPR-associated protein Csm3
MPQLTNIHTIEATLELVTGLRISAGDAEMHIGGVDNTVIKHPITQSPYIPGSSLKGKMRSLLEWKTGAVQEKPLGLADLDRANDLQ